MSSVRAQIIEKVFERLAAIPGVAEVVDVFEMNRPEEERSQFLAKLGTGPGQGIIVLVSFGDDKFIGDDELTLDEFFFDVQVMQVLPKALKPNPGRWSILCAEQHAKIVEAFTLIGNGQAGEVTSDAGNWDGLALTTKVLGGGAAGIFTDATNSVYDIVSSGFVIEYRYPIGKPGEVA